MRTSPKKELLGLLEIPVQEQEIGGSLHMASEHGEKSEINKAVDLETWSEDFALAFAAICGRIRAFFQNK
jgi:hypothetical protein